MAKKIVRGITDVKTINNQDYDTNNVNDLLSDGQYNYIHRKKGETEEYHNLTDNIKTISSDNTELLTVTNNNKTTNTATLHPKHDAQKEQLLESTRNTVTINHGANGTAEKTTVDTNPQKVLEHSNLVTDYGISKTTTGNTTKLGLEYTTVENGFDLDNLVNGNVRGEKFVNAPDSVSWFFVSSHGGMSAVFQEAYTIDATSYRLYKRYKGTGGTWRPWREQLADKSVIDGLLAQKQDTLVAGEGITIQGNTISATGGATHTIERYRVEEEWGFRGYKQVVSNGVYSFVTVTFECDPNFTEHEVTGDIKRDLEKFVGANKTVSNGAVSLTNDGTTMKLIKSGGSQNVHQQGTFTFFDGAIPS